MDDNSLYSCFFFLLSPLARLGDLPGGAGDQRVPLDLEPAPQFPVVQRVPRRRVLVPVEVEQRVVAVVADERFVAGPAPGAGGVQPPMDRSPGALISTKAATSISIPNCAFGSAKWPAGSLAFKSTAMNVVQALSKACQLRRPSRGGRK